ncbi:hypothetical protein QYE76_054904 [Lolium multiflorum]|uniref:CCHC-type domain-containing protein n=1 Tax=Lolium multiflorum TaxID=4521 RepID=A0AAD8WNY4_LOLMU|nr:hypothetical protein QYE76_054904 [Lolium multiflorum]
MIRELKVIFETHAAVESYEASKQFFGCMMEEGSSVSEHVFAMSGHAKKLSDLGIVIPNQLGIHRVLQSLPPSYKNFVMNYNMQNMNKELPELFSMLKSAEVEIRKENQVLMVNKTTSFKKQGKPNKGNFKKGGKKVVAPPEKPKAGPKPDTVCYYCKEKGHWKRNCPKYLADLKSGHVKKKGCFANGGKFPQNGRVIEFGSHRVYFGTIPVRQYLSPVLVAPDPPRWLCAGRAAGSVEVMMAGAVGAGKEAVEEGAGRTASTRPAKPPLERDEGAAGTSTAPPETPLQAAMNVLATPIAQNIDPAGTSGAGGDAQEAALRGHGHHPGSARAEPNPT